MIGIAFEDFPVARTEIAHEDSRVSPKRVVHEKAVVANQAFGLDEDDPALHGLPVGVKDIIDTADMPTQNGTVIDAGRQPKEDAAVVMRLRQAGAVILGKTTSTELAYMHPTETKNPHNVAHTPGGSSAGSAAAVASNMVPLAVGTQTGGSIVPSPHDDMSSPHSAHGGPRDGGRDARALVRLGHR